MSNKQTGNAPKSSQQPQAVAVEQLRTDAVAKLKKDREDARPHRLKLLGDIAASRGSYVLSYVTSNRPHMGTMIGSDAIRIFREVVGGAKTHDKLDLVLVTHGGHTLTPLRLVSLFREFFKEVNVLIPYMAHSAGTLIALGMDSIVMGAMGELGPVDPSVTNHFNPTIESEDAKDGKLPTPRPRIPISVEDVTSYLSLAIDRAKLDAPGMSAAFSALAEKVSPLALGNIVRHHSLIRHLARRLLMMHMDKEADKAAIDSVVETLTEKLYAHDYLITRDEAASLGLKVKKPDNAVEAAMWELYKSYEAYLGIGVPINFPAILGSERHRYLCVDGGLIEDLHSCHYFCFRGLAERKGADEFGFNAEFSSWEGV